MKKTHAVRFGVVLLLLMLVLQACHLPGASDDDLSVDARAQTMVAQTLAAQEGDGDGGGDADTDGGGDNAAPEPSLTTAPSPTLADTPTPTITLTATITLTPTLSTPMVSVSVDTNCRTGPGKIYDYIGALLVGEMAEVVGQSMDGQYWIIKNPDLAGECWLWGNYATVEGPTTGLPKYTPPPTPTPVFAWAGTWNTYTGDIGGPFMIDVLTVTVDEKNLTATIDLGGGDVVTLTGTISDDYLSVSGNYTSPGITGTFVWYALGTNQFQGKGMDPIGSFAWCGSRSGAGQPAPCYKD
jgi:hypothetical protein